VSDKGGLGYWRLLWGGVSEVMLLDSLAKLQQPHLVRLMKSLRKRVRVRGACFEAEWQWSLVGSCARCDADRHTREAAAAAPRAPYEEPEVRPALVDLPW
jgi:hypothetical protein